MAFFSTQFLNAPSRKLSQRVQRPRDDLDDFLSSDLELSFASTMSLNSPQRDSTPPTPENQSPQPMDISPAPPTRSRPPTENFLKPVIGRPRASTSAATRAFGRDMSNGNNLQVPANPKSGSSYSQSKRTQRSALPLEWIKTSNVTYNENMFVAPQEPFSPASVDAMDIDYFIPGSSAPTCTLLPAAPVSAAPTITEFNYMFHGEMAPSHYLESPAGPQPKKRRSSSPRPLHHYDEPSSSPPPSSPSQQKFERLSAAPLAPPQFTKPSLGGLGNPSLYKRPRRPAFSAMVKPSDLPSAHLPTEDFDEDDKLVVVPPTRRAFSALVRPQAFDLSSDDSSFDGPDMSSPAQAYAKRQQIKTIRRCDGTDDFRPLTGATAMVKRESPSAKLLAAGLPGFGDNEAHGKILPCHRVREDGLMRINPQTLNNLLDGVYDSKIHDFHVIDCRFDYEYSGGHVLGAVNINTTSGIEDFFLRSDLVKPRPCTSGDASKKTVLVFHCEFSAKRAPTFAKHLRSKDRALNNHVYPKVHYPEVYVLEGGYCQYFKESGSRCEPPGYVPMDDPNHAASRKEDLDQFRRGKFGRTRSYAYGDLATKLSQQQTQMQQKRNTAPSGGAPPALFAAANAARTRRGGLTTLAEDGNSLTHSDDEETDIGDSPCPPPTKGGLKKKVLRPLVRAETYGPTRMAY